jgi:hypothetical protein
LELAQRFEPLQQQVEPVAVFQAQIGHDDVERIALQRLMGLQGGAGAEYGVPLAGQIIDQHAPQLFVIVNDENLIKSGK